MPLSDVHIHEFMILWKKATGEDMSSEEARLVISRLLQFYRVLVHPLPSNRSPTAEACRLAENVAQLTPESS